MYQRLSSAWILIVTLFFNTLAGAAPAGVSRVILGWKGLQSGDKFKPIVSGAGELGKVLYIADGTDLARSFARTGTHVCEITADASAWHSITKVWVSQAQIASHKGAAMEKLYPGAVLFASHTAAGLAAHQDRGPWQMGIREGALARLKVQGECYPVADKKVRPGLKLDYPALGAANKWNIQHKAERGP